MAKQSSLLKFRQGMTFNDLQRTVAERDDMLAQYYVGKERYVDRALSRDDEASVFIGPKGVGKSAILQMVRLDQRNAGNTDRLLEIAPDDLAFKALVNIDSRTPLLSNPGSNQWLFTSLWDYVLSVAILARETPGRAGIAGLFTKLFGTHHQKEQERLLNLTFDDDGTQSTMTDKMLALVSAIELSGKYADTGVSAKLHLADSSSAKHTDLQLLQLISNVAKNLSESLTHEYYILIDDLDLHWTGSELQDAFLGSMFFSIRKLSRSRKVKFVVSLRESIYRQVKLEERDKFSPLVCPVNWDRPAVEEMIVSRISFAMNITPEKTKQRLFPSNAFDRMWEATDGMPREVIRLAVRTIDEAISNGSPSVTEEDMRAGINVFSKDRRDDLCSEYIHFYPNMRIVLKQFSGGHKEFHVEHLREIAFSLADMEDSVSEISNIEWATCGVDNPLEFARSLLRIGFLLLKDGRSDKPRFAEEDDLLMLDDTHWYSIHPMYAPGLGLSGT